MFFKKKRVKSKKTEERELDEMWKKRVKERDNYTCQICNKILTSKQSRAHHIIPRMFGRGLRWEVLNGITLCDYHHRLGVYSPHQNAVWFYGWLKANKPQQLKYILEKLKQYGK